MRILLILALAAGPALHAGSPPSVVKNVMVYKESGRYGGWPANHGIWQWGNEILVGFSGAYYKHMPANRHQYDNSKPEEPKLARSLDGGETWTIESPKSLLPPEQGGLAVKDLPAPINFRDRNFAMTIRLSDVDKGHSRLWYSTDRGKTWNGPYGFPDLGQPGILARTDYIVNGKHDAFAFLTASKQNGKEGRVICTRTTDGGMSWKLVSFIGAEPEGFAIMPSTVRLSKTKLVTAVRMKAPPDKTWLDLYASPDNGANWHILPSPVPDTGGHGGNPASMIRLRDGRLCLTYGVRSAPFSVRTRLSSDGGRTWTNEFTIRGDGAAWDIGYPRTVQRPDGKVVTVYYFPETVSSGRTIEATIWAPGQK